MFSRIMFAVMAVIFLVAIQVNTSVADIGYESVAGHRVMIGTMEESIKDHLEFLESDSTFRRGDSRLFAWGTGEYAAHEYDTIRFNWMIHADSSGTLVVYLDISILDDHIIEIEDMVGVGERYWSAYNIFLDEDQQQSLIWTDNDWINTAIKAGDGMYRCDEEAIVKQLIARLEECGFFTDMKIAGYLR